MPRGRRPWKYETDEQRADARRERVRLNVRALRERRRAEAEAQRAVTCMTSRLSTEPNIQQRKEYKFIVATTLVKKRKRTRPRPDGVLELTPVAEVVDGEYFSSRIARETSFVINRFSPSTYDVATHSHRAPIDLEFNALSTIVNNWKYISADKLPWQKALQDSRLDIDRLLELAIGSASSQYIGHMTNDRNMLGFSSGAYHHTLAVLRNRYHTDWTVKAPGIVVAQFALFLVSLLSKYVNKLDDNKELVEHSRAFNETMALAGPSTFRGSFGMTVLRGTRPVVILVCITTGDPCFLDDPGWRRLPLLQDIYTPRISFSMAQDTFWDLAAQVATVVNRVNKTLTELYAPQASAMTRGNAARLAAALEDLREKLSSWHSSAEKDTQLYSEISTALGPSPYIFLTGHVFHFKDLPVAELMASYWTYTFYLWDVSDFYYRSLAAISVPGSSLIPSSSYDVSSMAGMICQCIWWFMTPEAPPSTLCVYASFPLRVATRFYQRNPDQWRKELKWCLATSDRISNSGMAGGIAEFFVDPFIPRMFQSRDIR